ncbi:MAG: hypothetical protein ACRD47_14520, partial [Nitrososphaeraceae archaeon]
MRKSKNVIFRACMGKLRYDIFEWTLPSPFPSLLEDLEDALHHFKFREWKYGEKRSLQKDITSPDFFKSNEAITELLTAFSIIKKGMSEKIWFHHQLSSGKVPDL